MVTHRFEKASLFFFQWKVFGSISYNPKCLLSKTINPPPSLWVKPLWDVWLTSICHIKQFGAQTALVSTAPAPTPQPLIEPSALVGFRAMFIKVYHLNSDETGHTGISEIIRTWSRSPITERAHEWIRVASLFVAVCEIVICDAPPRVRMNRNISLWSNNPRLKHNAVAAFVSLYFIYIFYLWLR